jgi:ribosomal-protein-serine acetyltransferase
MRKCEPPAEIGSDRVMLRRLAVTDAACLWDATDESREHIGVWMPWIYQCLTPEDNQQFLQRIEKEWDEKVSFRYGIWENLGNRLIGTIGLMRIDWDVPSFEMYYWLRASAAGKGFATVSAWSLCAAAFRLLGANRVQIHCDSDNVKSAAVAQRLGFVLEGTLRNQSRDRLGVLHDLAIFSMTPDEFRQTEANVR